ncbi:MAG TPA: HAD-IIB family hydrolase [Gammaproteobacteria bacterium]|nr:HAD-IIB family hydrolase [Gammaproteobacteria bacterium]
MTERLLATDMDRTLLPNGLQEADPDALDRFRTWAGHRAPCLLAYVTGRHWSLARGMFGKFDLPEPDWLVCNVGTEIYARGADRPLEEWRSVLERDFDAEAIRKSTDGALPGARLQESEKQSSLKVSYYLDGPPPRDLCEEMQERIGKQGLAARVVVSYDETEELGLVDFLAPGSGKANALTFLRRHLGLARDRVLFSGDSGNDSDALLSGVCGVLVGNATEAVRERLRQALPTHPEARIYFAQRPYTAGILEGMAHYGWEGS